jgi:hypothetical protein
LYEKSWDAIGGEKWKCNWCMIVAVIGAVVKQKFTPNAPYGIDSCYCFEVISQFPKVHKYRRVAVPF